jgi:hypothetical protein
MSGKHHRVAAFVDSLSKTSESSHHPCYSGYFTCFNVGDYYEAHDVLEHLWLECSDDNHNFYKGLIQIAGAFVHLKKQHSRPDHPVDGRRLHPAARLLSLGSRNIAPYGPVHMDLDIQRLCAVCCEWKYGIERHAFSKNPWNPDSKPAITLLNTD